MSGKNAHRLGPDIERDLSNIGADIGSRDCPNDGDAGITKNWNFNV